MLPGSEPRDWNPPVPPVNNRWISTGALGRADAKHASVFLHFSCKQRERAYPDVMVVSHLEDFVEQGSFHRSNATGAAKALLDD